MSVAGRLRLAVALFLALLAAVLVYHVRTVQRVQGSALRLTQLSERLRRLSGTELPRIAEMRTTAEKYAVSRDPAYFAKLESLAREHGIQPAADLRVFDSLESRARRDAQRTQDAMTAELSQATRLAAGAERLSWMAAFAALLFGTAVAALLVRSIVGPLARLAEGTRALSRGQFAHRVALDGDDELARVAREFDHMAQRLGELDRLKRDFVSRVSHDLKTPLTSMQETANALADGLAGPVSPAQRRLLEMHRESGQRLAGMIGKLLELARLEALPAPPIATVDVTDLARRAVERANLGAASGGRGAPVALQAGAPHVVRGDADGLAEVLDNLIENAVKFSPADGRVVVTLADHGADVLLRVADEGPGIAEGDRERVFDRFHQGASGRDAAGRGVGLGLTICRHIVTAHGGRIWVEDNAPRGTVLCLRVPGVQRPASASVKRAAGSVQRHAAAFDVQRTVGGAVLCALLLTGVLGCAHPARRGDALHAATRDQLEARIAALVARVDSLQRENDLLQGRVVAADSARLAGDEQLRALRTELDQLKAIDLRSRVVRRPYR